MDTQNLQAFIAVAERASFSLAADALHLTQPAVTKRIQALENQVGRPLFDRIGRRIALTEAGQVLLPRARKILQEVEECRRSLADLGGQVGGELALATSHHVGLHRLPPVLRRFTADYPEVSLELSFLSSEQAYDQVLNGQVELAVITLSPKPHPAIRSSTIWDDPLHFVASPVHPLAQANALDLDALARFPAILPDVSTYTTQIVKQLFDSRYLSLQIKLATNFLETIKMMVSIDLGWSVLPETLIDDQLCVLQIPGIQLKRELGTIRHRERSLSNAANAFIGALNSELNHKTTT